MFKKLRNIIKLVVLVKPLRTLFRMRRFEMLNYPTTIDLECVTTIISIVKSREIQARRQEFCKCGWNVAGYLLFISIGEPNTNPTSMYAHSGALQDSLEELEGVLTEYQNGEQEFSASNEKEAGDIGTVIMIISTVLNLLRALGFIKQDDEEEDEE